jgi:hypothetical protein
MTDKPKPPDDDAQSQRFIDMAREVEADGSKDSFDRAFDVIVNPHSPERRLPQTTGKKGSS